eukprot:TRINITY_DN18694_c0_g1_i6.p1 TRINITY_DN18694_c0_g1~~TRINITY_DN18694_c0_g1_i6.p1  ORF type:complete len:527 (-),score=102.56 TRINITY_DN18694_c0_g1_i6:72-1652(-)
MIRRPPRSTLSSSSAASDVYKRQVGAQTDWPGWLVDFNSLQPHTAAALIGVLDPKELIIGIASAQAGGLQHPCWVSVTVAARRDRLLTSGDSACTALQSGNGSHQWDCINCLETNSSWRTICWECHSPGFHGEKLTADNVSSIVQPWRARSEAQGTPVGCAYDMQMLSHQGPENHPERPDRLRVLVFHLVQCGMVDKFLNIQARMATPAELQLVHSAMLLQQVNQSASCEPFEGPISETWGDSYACTESAAAAALAAGTVVEVTLQVLAGKVPSGIALVRPPGHHAEPGKCMGFCLYNNVAIAARAALAQGAKRVLILDWDIHHGNGTQEAFWTDPAVLYISLHRFPFYPGGAGDPANVGAGEGTGFNVNIGWPMGGVGDAAYMQAFEMIVMPVSTAFQPDIVLVSAGFDAAEGDPLGGCCLSPNVYFYMTRRLQALANGKVVLALEGGYNLCSIARSLEACAHALLGGEPKEIKYRSAQKMEVQAIEEALAVHAEFWPCLRRAGSGDEVGPHEDVEGSEIVVELL